MGYRRSELNAVVLKKSDLVFLVGSALDSAASSTRLVQVYDMKDGVERVIHADEVALPLAVRWYGSTVLAINDSVDALVLVGGHEGDYADG